MIDRRGFLGAFLALFVRWKPTAPAHVVWYDGPRPGPLTVYADLPVNTSKHVYQVHDGAIDLVEVYRDGVPVRFDNLGGGYVRLT